MELIGDLMFAFAVWLKTTPLVHFAAWIQKTPLNGAVNSNIWFAPVVQTTHILAVAASITSALMVSLRVLRVVGRSRTLAETAARYMPWIWWALLVLLLTGLFLIIGEPSRELLNPAFWTKMVLIIVSILVSLGFQDWVRRSGAQWELTSGGSLAMRMCAGGVIFLWCVIIVLGRWIAYAPV